METLLISSQMAQLKTMIASDNFQWLIHRKSSADLPAESTFTYADPNRRDVQTD